MKAGVSTASLYPLHAEDAFRELAQLGVTTAELFANSTAEAREPVTGIIRDTMQEYGMEVVSFHPFSSPMESVYLFSEYDRRIEEMLTMYREFFGTMNRLGAKIFVLHGAILSSGCTPEHYVKQFRLLAEAAEEYGVTVAQENVSYCLSGRLDFLRMMKRELGKYAKFVLDLKQCRRCGHRPEDVVAAMGSALVHVHISDNDARRDCLPPGKGAVDYDSWVRLLASVGFDGPIVLELYRTNFERESELVVSYRVLEDAVSRVKKP